ncbi:Protein of unknown function [Fodinibius roseus]|uniref:DUF1499 domain-containing protein n=1 Tax=Fodinibius roseus TaxID=1194090 RepID=A0A1M4SIV7_9BACT|nr:DUF1499 domain-containing protein [Fodinibius roseus]SHE32145.1 Protein of unknown function [Fodinibius roseus]
MKKNRISRWALFSMIFGIAAVLVLLLSGYGYQWNWWELGVAFSWLLPASAVLALIGLALALVYLFARWKGGANLSAKTVTAGVVLGLAVLVTVGYWFYQAQQYPPIHDISTDIDNPPEFRGIVPLRAEASNDTTYGDREKADTQREHYPDIQTLYLEEEYPEAFDRALEAARQMPWEQIVTSDKEQGLIEAFDKLPWFGFIDDVVIRVDTAETRGRSKIDVRSVSRIGRGDIGVNAHRIREYLEVVRNMRDNE